MKTGYWRLSMGALVLAIIMMPNAKAECGIPFKQVKPANWAPQYAAPRLLRASETESIVGMWHVTFTAETLNGAAIPKTIVDNALVVWHSDKTEIMNSGRPPQDGDFCMGVWEQTGESAYKLNHFAWGSNAFPNTSSNGIGEPAGPTHIVEEVTLSPGGNHFSGKFTLDAYDSSGNITSFTGVVTATRITINTTVGDLL